MYSDGRMERAAEVSYAKRGNSGDSSDRPCSERVKKEEDILKNTSH